MNDSFDSIDAENN
jgi:hypothetical protein